MRFFKKYRFQVGKKVEFKDLFAVVDNYMKEHCLSYTSMGYHLQSLDDRCHQAAKRMPQLGQVTHIETPYSTWALLSNMTGDTFCDEASIRLVGSKIPRPYNFSDVHFYYRDIDFFGVQPGGERIGHYTNPQYLQIFGNWIGLQRDFEGPKSTAVVMCVEITNAYGLDGADAYAKALAACLGNAKYVCGTELYMDANEKTEFDRLKEAALPLVKVAHDDLYDRAEHVREKMLQQFLNVEYKQFSIRPILQRIGKKHGFDQFYSIPGFETYIYKKVRNGIYLSVQLMPGSGMDAGLVLSGPGFHYRIVDFSGHPENSAEANFFVERMLSLADRFEEMYMDTILELYPQFPDWCPVFLED